MLEDKSKRGRPPLLSPEAASRYRALYSEIHTSRQIQARACANRALIAMDRAPKSATEFPPPTWLVDWEVANTGKQGAVKWGVLEELGRMLAAGIDIEGFVAALEADDHTLTAKQAAALMREFRLRGPTRDRGRDGPSV
jgi:hypothetical protein